MARRPRCDEPGSWHHVVNRALSKRPYFETRSDQRAFLALLAQEVRRERIRVHAFCLMTTHFHLLVESPVGELSEAMRVVENTYSRRFNRIRQRDGPRVRARFLSKRIRTEVYRRAVVRYIDRNPVTAGIVDRPGDYAFCSAPAHMSGVGSPWLERSWILACLDERCDRDTLRAAAYAKVFGGGSGSEPGPLEQLVEARLRSGSEVDPLDDLIGAKPVAVRQWLAGRAALADGMRVGLPICTPAALLDAISRDVQRHGPWYVEEDGRIHHGSEIALVGLLRELCSATWPQVLEHLRIPLSRAHRRGKVHDRMIRESETYGRRVSAISSAALQGAPWGCRARWASEAG
jgi:REP element-mobilizing transposase RayT